MNYRDMKKALKFMVDTNTSKEWQLVYGILKHGMFSGYSVIGTGELYPVFFHDSKYWAVEYVNVPGRNKALGFIYRIDYKTGEVLEKVYVGFRNDFILLSLLLGKISRYISLTPLEACIQNDFSGFYDKAGKEYWHHPVFVAESSVRIAEKCGLSRENQMYCYLVGMHHDHIEDIPNGEECIRENLFFLEPDELEKVITYVKILTKGKRQSYDRYFQEILECPEKVVRCVKAADALHNSDLSRFSFWHRTKEIRVKCKFYKEHYNTLIKTLKREVNNG